MRIRIYLLLLILIGTGIGTAKSQTILQRGDLAVLGVNSNISSVSTSPYYTKDEISFVCFKNITTGTELQLLDAGYQNCTANLWSCGQEGGAKFTRTGSTIMAGTVITFRTTTTGYTFLYPDNGWSVTDLFVHPTNTNYSVLAADFNINAGGDQLYFCQGGTWTEQSTLCTIGGTRTSPNANFPGNNGRVLFGFSTSGNWQSFQQSSGESGLYPGMECFSMAPTNTAFSKYTGLLTATTQTGWISRISNPSNWSSFTQSTYTGYTNYQFIITPGGDIPTATWTAPSSALCSDGTSINLNNLVTGTTGGTWSGTGVTGNTFNPIGLNGFYSITYSIQYNSGAGTCPITQTNTIRVVTAAAPSVTSTVNYCQNATSIPLSATGSNLLWYTAANGGTSSSTAPTPSTTTPTTTTYYVSQTTSGCESPRALITVTVSAPPTINAVNNQSVCNNSNTAAINFSGTGTALYNWTNNTTSIGLAASGTGNIASFQALNSGTTPVTATITATPVSTGFAYVPNYGTYPLPAGNSVSVINTTTNAIAGTITVGSNPFGVAVSPDGTKVYVTNYGSNSVSVIGTATNTVTATITVGSQPMGIAVTPDGTKVYVVNQNLLGNPGNVSVIDAATNTVLATVPVYLRPLAIAISQDGTKAYVASVNSDNVTVINTATNTVATVIAVGVQPTAVAISPDGSRLYVTNFANNNVSIINTSTNTVIATTPVGTAPNGAAISPDGSKLYITNQFSNNISIINTSTNTVTSTIPTGSQPHGISFTSDGSKAYIANFGSNNISVINTATNAVTNTVTVGTAPHSLGNFITPSSGCSGTPITFNITVGVLPTATYNYSSTSFCATGIATPTITGATGGLFSGSGSGLVIDPTTGVVDLAASTPGSYTPKYNVTVGGCNTTVTTNITINASPSMPVVSVVQSTCSAPTGTITVTSPIGAYTYSVDGTNFQSSPTFNNLAPNTYTVTVKNASGCTNTTTVTINGGSTVPVPTYTIMQANCSNVNNTLITVTSPTGAGYTYSIDGTNFQASTTFSVSPGTYTLTVKDVSGCSNSQSNIVATANPQAPPQATFTVTPVSCTTSGGITITSPIGSFYFYQLNSGPTQASPVFTNLSPGSYTVHVLNMIFCDSYTTAVVTGSGSPVTAPVTNIVQPTCTTTTGSITITSPIGTGLTYSIDGTTFQASTTFNNLVPNTYTVTVKNASGCTNTSSATINITSILPAPTYTATQPTCTVSTGSIAVLSPIGNTFEYSIDGITFQYSGTFTNIAPGPYTLTVRNGGGCTNTTGFTVNPPSAAPAAPTTTSPVTYCQNAAATAMAANGNNLLWYTTSTGGTGNSTSPTPSTATVGTTNYFVSQTINGCESPRTMIAVDIIAAPTAPTISANGTTSFCEGGNVLLTSSTATGNQWYRDGVLLTGATNTTYTASQTGTYTVTVNNAANCSATSAPTSVIAFPNPIVSAGPDLFVNELDSAKLQGSATQGTTFSYLWTPNSYLSDDTLAQPWIVKPKVDGYYTLNVINENGCINSDGVFVKVQRDLIIPNAFSPNGDNVNDKWEITNLDTYPYCLIEVFNRNGQIVYTAVGNKFWDGTYKGKPLPIGVYYYIINPKNGRGIKSGTVTLLR